MFFHILAGLVLLGSSGNGQSPYSPTGGAEPQRLYPSSPAQDHYFDEEQAWCPCPKGSPQPSDSTYRPSPTPAPTPSPAPSTYWPQADDADDTSDYKPAEAPASSQQSPAAAAIQYYVPPAAQGYSIPPPRVIPAPQNQYAAPASTPAAMSPLPQYVIPAPAPVMPAPQPQYVIPAPAPVMPAPQPQYVIPAPAPVMPAPQPQYVISVPAPQNSPRKYHGQGKRQRRSVEQFYDMHPYYYAYAY